MQPGIRFLAMIYKFLLINALVNVEIMLTSNAYNDTSDPFPCYISRYFIFHVWRFTFFSIHSHIPVYVLSVSRIAL